MQVKDITPNDEKYIIQLHRILARVLKELKFNIADARVIDDTIQWYGQFAEICGKQQELEKKLGDNPVPAKSDGLNDVLIKDYNPGDLSVVGGKAKGKTKAKSKSKKRK